jgi:hypothetical protein
MDSSKRQDGIGGSRLFCFVRTAKSGYSSCESVVMYNFLLSLTWRRQKIFMLSPGNDQLYKNPDYSWDEYIQSQRIEKKRRAGEV